MRAHEAGHASEEDRRVGVLGGDSRVGDPEEPGVSARRWSRLKRVHEVLLVPHLPGGDRAAGPAGELALITGGPVLAAGTVPADRGSDELPPTLARDAAVERRGLRGLGGPAGRAGEDGQDANATAGEAADHGIGGPPVRRQQSERLVP